MDSETESVPSPSTPTPPPSPAPSTPPDSVPSPEQHSPPEYVGAAARRILYDVLLDDNSLAGLVDAALPRFMGEDPLRGAAGWEQLLDHILNELDTQAPYPHVAGLRHDLNTEVGHHGLVDEALAHFFELQRRLGNLETAACTHEVACTAVQDLFGVAPEMHHYAAAAGYNMHYRCASFVIKVMDRYHTRAMSAAEAEAVWLGLLQPATPPARMLAHICAGVRAGMIEANRLVPEHMLQDVDETLSDGSDGDWV